MYIYLKSTEKILHKFSVDKTSLHTRQIGTGMTCHGQQKPSVSQDKAVSPSKA